MFRTLSSKNNYKTKKTVNGVLSKQTGLYKIQSFALTVLWGSMLAISIAFTIAVSDGLQTIGVFGKPESGRSWSDDKYVMMSKISSLLWMLSRLVEFNDSKQTIPSKQSSNPSLSRALAACNLSAFVKICEIVTDSCIYTFTFCKND